MVCLSIITNEIVGNSLETVFCFYLAEKKNQFLWLPFYADEDATLFADIIIEGYH